MAETLKPVVEQKIREAVKGMIGEAVKSLNTAHSTWQKNNQKVVRDMISKNKTDLVSCTKGVETVVQQMIDAGKPDLRQSASELIQGIESVVTECDKSWVKVIEQMEKALKEHGDSVKGAIFDHGDGVKEAIFDLSQKEAEVQRHLANIFSELSEMRHKINDIPAVHWQYQQAGGNSGTMVVQQGLQGAGVEVEIQDAASVAEDSVAAAVNDAIMAAVTDSVVSAVGDSVEGGDDLLDVPSEGEGEMSAAGVIQDMGAPSAGVDPGLLDKPCDDGAW